MKEAIVVEEKAWDIQPRKASAFTVACNPQALQQPCTKATLNDTRIMHYKRVMYSPLETRSDAYIQNGMQSLCKFLHTTPTPKQLYKLDVIVFRGFFFF